MTNIKSIPKEAISKLKEVNIVIVAAVKCGPTKIDGGFDLVTIQS